MRSMTGFGGGEAVRNGIRVRVELAAVNRKQLDLRLTLPAGLGSLETPLRAHAQRQLGRGAYAAVFSVEYPPDSPLPAGVALNPALIGALARQWRQVAEQVGIPLQPLTLRDVAAIPGAVLEAGAGGRGEVLEALSFAAFDQAVAAVRAMQAREGERLHADLEAIRRRMVEAVARIRERTDESLVNCRDRLLERVRLLGLHLEVMDERLAKEVAFWAERSDINEEVIRLESHLGQLAETMAKPEPVGRALDFLCQEMGREINTLAAKTAETAIVHQALELKADLERLREQVQNIE